MTESVGLPPDSGVVHLAPIAANNMPELPIRNVAGTYHARAVGLRLSDLSMPWLPESTQDGSEAR
jgi:hypothetical protein